MQQCSLVLAAAMISPLMQAPSHNCADSFTRQTVLECLCQGSLVNALQGPPGPATPLPGQLPPSDLAAPVDDASDTASSSDVASLEEIRAVIADMDRDDNAGRDAAAE